MLRFCFIILICAIVSTSYAEESYIPTFKGSFPVGAECVMHFKTNEVLAEIFIEATGQTFIVEKVHPYQKFREVTNGTYYGPNGASLCERHRREYGKKHGLPL